MPRGLAWPAALAAGSTSGVVLLSCGPPDFVSYNFGKSMTLRTLRVSVGLQFTVACGMAKATTPTHPSALHTRARPYLLSRH